MGGVCQKNTEVETQNNILANQFRAQGHDFQNLGPIKVIRTAPIDPVSEDFIEISRRVEQTKENIEKNQLEAFKSDRS